MHLSSSAHKTLYCVTDVVLSYSAGSLYRWHRVWDRHCYESVSPFYLLSVLFSFVEGAGVKFWYVGYTYTTLLLYVFVSKRTNGKFNYSSNSVLMISFAALAYPYKRVTTEGYQIMCCNKMALSGAPVRRGRKVSNFLAQRGLLHFSHISE